MIDQEEDDIYDAVLLYRKRTHYYERIHSKRKAKKSRRVININYSIDSKLKPVK